ncbi:MAG: MFS transporter [Mobilicoccus sp.]|nr:MFS transporter [Mobilicoccus sp.]
MSLTTGPARARLRELPAPLQLMLMAQLCFNIGFYLVVPFLADHLEGDLLLTSATVALILGLRTFSQQGLFFVGGAIVDAVGIRPAITTGCAIRIAGFVVLGFAESVAGIVTGVLLVGIAAALFSPAAEAATSIWAGDVEAAGGPSRTQIWGLFSLFGQVGALVGPALGGLLLPVSFRVTTTAAAAVFVIVLLGLALGVPREERSGPAPRLRTTLAVAVQRRDVLAFALVNSCALLLYNQLYLALPTELGRTGAPSGSVTWFFAGAAALTVLGQMAVSRRAAAHSSAAALRVGYAVLAAAPVPVALVLLFDVGDACRYVALIAFVALVTLGEMIVLPVARDLVGQMAGASAAGVCLGLLTTVGGVVVLLVNPLIGALFDLDAAPWAPWLCMAVAPTLAVLALPRVVRATR